MGIRDKLDVVASEINALRDERKALACEMAHLEGVQAKSSKSILRREISLATGLIVDLEVPGAYVQYSEERRAHSRLCSNR